MRSPQMRGCLLAFAALLCSAQPDLAQLAAGPPPEAPLPEEIRLKMAEYLNRLPNYTCTQTIQRSRRLAPRRRFELVDTVRLEVALVEGRELFGWPGANRIAESELSKLVDGAIGNGDFALLAKSIFLTAAARFTAGAAATLDGNPALRYQFRVPLRASGYHLKVPPREAVVGYHGWFWIHPETLELLRMEVAADDIPAYLGLASAANAMDYGMVEIGGSRFLLPRASELTLTQLDGTENRNATRYSGCRQFAGESVLSFGDAPAAAPASAPRNVPAIDLPDDFAVDISLDTPIDFAVNAVGDPVQATLTQSLKRRRQTVAPKGAILSGHISRLLKTGRAYRFAIAFDSLDFAGGRADLRARSNVLSMAAQLRESGAFRDTATTTRSLEISAADADGIEIRAERLRLPSGCRLILRSRLLESKED